MSSNHLFLCRPLLLPPSTFPSVKVFSNESALCIRWPKDWSFSFSISPSNEHSGLISFRMDWLYLLAVQGTLVCLWLPALSFPFIYFICYSVSVSSNVLSYMFCDLVFCCVYVLTYVLTLLWTHGLYSPPGSSVRRILQAGILEWVAISSSAMYIFRWTALPICNVLFCSCGF